MQVDLEAFRQAPSHHDFMTGFHKLHAGHQPEFMTSPWLTDMNATLDYQLLMIQLRNGDPLLPRDTMQRFMDWASFRPDELQYDPTQLPTRLEIQAQRVHTMGKDDHVKCASSARFTLQRLSECSESVTMTEKYIDGNDFALRIVQLILDQNQPHQVGSVTEKKEVGFSHSPAGRPNSSGNVSMSAEYRYSPIVDANSVTGLNIALVHHTILTPDVELINTRSTADMVRTALPPSDPTAYFATMYR